jgi:uncharacterized membrane protein
MLSLVLAAIFFVGIHVCIAGTRLRGLLVARLGEGGFLGLFSALSFAGLIWLTTAYADAPYAPLWGELYALKPLVLIVMLAAFVLVVVGLTTPSPTAMGGAATLDAEEPARGILRITRHPFLSGVALRAAAHLIVNGEASALVLFGSLLVLALVGPGSIDRKRRRALGARWDRFEAVTSRVPFVAILQGRNRFVASELPRGMLVLAVVVYVAVLATHGLLFGVSPLPR